MYRGIECKIYPNKRQLSQIEQTFGCTRFVWNKMLNMLNIRYQNNSDLKMLSYSKISALLPTLKQEYPWLKDVDSVAIQCAVKTLSETFDRFFKRLCQYPKFKSKKITKQSYLSTIRGNNIRFNDNQRYLKLPKLGWVKCKPSVRHIENERIKSVTIKRNSTGHYYAVLLVESENQALPKTGASVGIDLGLTHLAITSDGEKFKSQRLHLKYKKQLHYWEKRVARRRLNAIRNNVSLIDAKNYQKAKQQVARIHEKIANTRKDYLHKITTSLVKRYDFIVLEDLKTSNLMKNHNIARAITNQAWRTFRSFIEYKSIRYGKTSMIVNPYKSSQYCSHCGHDSGKKTLDIRHWRCPSCHTLHDRDINASKNILKFGLEQALVK